MNGRGCTIVHTYSYGTGTIVFTQIFSAETVEAEKDSAPDPEYGTGTDCNCNYGILSKTFSVCLPTKCGLRDLFVKVR